MTEKHLYDMIKGLVAEFKEARADGVVTAGELGGIAISIAKAAEHTISAFQDDSHKEAMIKTCHDLYDEYLEPIDIPRVPNFAEKWIDNAAKNGITMAIENAYDQLEGK